MMSGVYPKGGVTEYVNVRLRTCTINSMGRVKMTGTIHYYG